MHTCEGGGVDVEALGSLSPSSTTPRNNGDGPDAEATRSKGLAQQQLDAAFAALDHECNKDGDEGWKEGCPDAEIHHMEWACFAAARPDQVFVTGLTCPQHQDHQPNSCTNPANSAAICTTHHELRLSIPVTKQQHTSPASLDFTSPSPRYPDPLLPSVSARLITTASPPSVLSIPNTSR
jgi:hypothetical protein